MSSGGLSRLRIRRFKLFEEVDLELGPRVVFVGPNNSGKSSALQALALWHLGVRKWLQKRGGKPLPAKRMGVAIGRRDLISVPVPAANLLWKDLRVRVGSHREGKTTTRNLPLEIEVEGLHAGQLWVCGLEFEYANEETLYARPLRTGAAERAQVPAHLAELRLAFLPPMSGLLANEVRLDDGAIQVRIGEGRTAEVLRNLCWQVLQARDGAERWSRVSQSMEKLFGVRIEEPRYVPDRGEIEMSYRTRDGLLLDLSSSGRGQQQTLLLLAQLAAHPGAVLLLDEPDAHLEVLRQRQIYQVITDMAESTGGQILAASHSEVILQEAADRDLVIAFVGQPHRIDDRGSQVLKALREIGFDQYYQAEVAGWVLYLEGATDLAILRAFARTLDHPAQASLDDPFVHYVANQPRDAQRHFRALREALPDLRGFALYDRLPRDLPEDPDLTQSMWCRREIENYLCSREVLSGYARRLGAEQEGELFAARWVEAMEEAIGEIERSLAVLRRSSPWSSEIKATDEFLDPLFALFFQRLDLPNLMRKTDYHTLVVHVAREAIDAEVVEVLDRIAATAARRGPAPR